MINLLPPEYKQNIIFARKNTKLLHWVFALIVTMLILLVIAVGGQVYVANSVKSYSKNVEETRSSLKTQKIDETQARLENISNGLKLIVQVLSKEVLFSKLLTQMGAAMPNGAVLDSIEISKTQGGIDLVAQATDYQTATQVQVNLQDPQNKLFEKVDINSIQCSATNKPYACTITMRAVFAKDNDFLFVHNQGAQQ
jgi:Tfp pilus assembly protein PilN